MFTNLPNYIFIDHSLHFWKFEIFSYSFLCCIDVIKTALKSTHSPHPLYSYFIKVSLHPKKCGHLLRRYK